MMGNAAAASRRHAQVPARFRWPVPLVGVVLILLGLAYLWESLNRPFDGAHLRPGTEAVTELGLRLSPVGKGRSPILDGDIVVAVEGQRLESLASALFSGSPSRSELRVGDILAYRVIRDGQELDIEVPLGRYPLAAVLSRTWGTVLYAIVTLAVATFLYLRRPRVRAVPILFLSAAALFGSTTWSLGATVGDYLDNIGFWLFHATTVLAFLVYWTAGFHFTLLFPKPLPIADNRSFVALIYCAPLVVVVFMIAAALPGSVNRLAWIGMWGDVTNWHAAVYLTLTLITAVVQYRRHPSGPGRQQIRWVLLGGLVAGSLGLVLYLLPPIFGATAVHPNFIGVLVSLFPVTIAIAILKHNLFDIEVLLNRTLVYGLLSTAVVAAYVGLVSGLGTLLQTRADTFVSLVITGFIAVLFQPLRDRLQRAVNRLMYGDRDDPEQALAHLGKRLEMALEPEAVLPTLVETIAQVLRLPYVAITQWQGDGGRVVASYGRSSRTQVTFPLVYQGAGVGELALEARGDEEDFSEKELHLLKAVAQHAGVATYAVAVTRDLRRSRERLVKAREEERLRLRRDLHDGLGPALAAMTLKLDAARNLLDREPAETRLLLDQISQHVQAVSADLRRLVYALRPPALDELGLVEAVRDQVDRCQRDGLRIILQVPDAMPRLSAAVEVAAYRIVQEALTNVLKHARANSCIVAIRQGTWLELSVADDGDGLPSTLRQGVGLTSMRERAEELGGRLTLHRNMGRGTLVTARLPLTDAA